MLRSKNAYARTLRPHLSRQVSDVCRFDVVCARCASCRRSLHLTCFQGFPFIEFYTGGLAPVKEELRKPLTTCSLQPTRFLLAPHGHLFLGRNVDDDRSGNRKLRHNSSNSRVRQWLLPHVRNEPRGPGMPPEGGMYRGQRRKPVLRYGLSRRL